MDVFALIGPSGSGKSHKAIFVAKELNCSAIIDDGLLIINSKVVAGSSAKKEKTWLGSVKRALLVDNSQAEQLRNALIENNITSLLIIATSKEMAQRIADRLGIGEIKRFIDIKEVSTEDEIKVALKTRMTEGKHVIPVPTFEVKKDFSGLLIYPLKIFKRLSTDRYFIAEKTIVRPTFSYLGSYVVSENVINSLIKHAIEQFESVYKISFIQIALKNNLLFIKVEIIFKFGYNIKDECIEIQRLIKNEIENITSINVEYIHILVKGVKI